MIKQTKLILALSARASGKPKLKAKIAKIKKKQALYDWLAR
jgi:hypothetical protein